MDKPEAIGEFDILETLGEGAAGVAYHARNRKTGEEVAIKLLHGKLDGDIDIQKRFIREVSVLQRLDHPNIVGHRDCGIFDDKFYLAMELVDGGTLAKAITERGALPWRPAVEVAVQVCRALQHAHDEGVIHRDLKPANLFLAADGGVKVGDFGLARDLQQHRLTLEGQTVGTCRFMAPEQVQGHADLTGAVDLYTLGCLLFQMLTGQPPYDGATVVEVFEKHLFGDIPRLKERVPDAPEALGDVITRLLAKDPADRPASADAARKLLEAVLAGEPLPEQDEKSLTDQITAPPEAPKPNLKVLAIMGGVAAAAAVVVWLILGRG